MQDLTTGPVARHLVKTAGFMLAMMVFQTLYFLVDLYWVGRLGTDAVAGVSLAGNVSFLTLAIGQVLAVGTTTAVAHAAGRKDGDAARHVFQQAVLLAVAVGVAFAAAGLLLRGPYAARAAADPAAAAAASSYLLWFVPAMALQFPFGAMGAALRATGQFRLVTFVSIGTVLLNMVLAPVLMFGWGTGRPMGVAGTAAASLVAVALGGVIVAAAMRTPAGYLRFARDGWRPDLAAWRRVLAVGLPAGAEFAMMALYQFVVYAVARPFGAPAQAGFGIGLRVVQAGFMPVVALGMAAAPVAGQNVGAGLPERVRATFRAAAGMAAGLMAVLTVLAHVAPAALVGVFTRDPAVVAVGAEYLRVISWNFVPSGLIFVASSLFQAMGNTLPPLAASAARMALVLGPAVALARLPGFQLRWVWYLAAGTVWFQCALCLWLLRREFGRRLPAGRPGADVLAGPGATPVGAPALEGAV
jgi:putative MATE family efflux protein